jgi:hypothetical protein
MATTKDILNSFDGNLSIGEVLLYSLTARDVETINRRRTSILSIKERIANNDAEIGDKTNFPEQWPLGAQAHIGSEVQEGQQFPLIVTKVFNTENSLSKSQVNGQLILDGSDTLWVTNIFYGPEKGQWLFIERY